MSSRTYIRNRNTGPGTQNNNNGVGTQNVIETHFVQNFHPSDSNAYKLLFDAVVDVGASHDAEQQYERGECLPRTREKAIEHIFNWILSSGEHPILWLTGAAGVGKTATAITIAKACQEQGRLVASFIFFRPDPKRDNPSALILSIAFGLITTSSLLRELIEQRISRDPRILNAQMEDQFRALVLKPLASAQKRHSIRQGASKHSRKVLGKQAVVIIDGLDECGDEQTQKRVLSTIQSAFEHSTSFPLRFLICSRPESWLRHAFDAKPLQQLHEHIVLDDSFEPNKDIERYYRHHFREIVNDPKHSQVSFPNPWPSEEEMEVLLELTDSQFVYAATAVRFINEGFILPTDQLQVVLKKTPPRRPGTSPFAQLDALYHRILSFNPHFEDIRLILAAILVFPGPAPSPACLELVLGLSKGQVALTLHGMHSVLDICGSDDKICLLHNSFREYLVDPNRSGPFYIDVDALTYIIVQTWLQNLSREKILSYSSSQLWDKKNKPFFLFWCILCTLIPEPTQDLLNLLYNLDLTATVFFYDVSRTDLVRWVEKYCVDPTAGENRVGLENGYHRKAGRALSSMVDGYPSHDSEQRDVNALGREMDTRRDGLDLVESVLYQLQNYPQCFHFEWPPGVSPSDDAVYWIIGRVTGCIEPTGSYWTQPSVIDDIRITECHCDLSGGKESRDPWHVAYQEACLKLVKAYISVFEELSQSGLDKLECQSIFQNLTESVLLKHCHLDTELLSLCRSFFELAKGFLDMQLISYNRKKGRQNMLKWFETFPDKFTAEGEALKVQLLDLPWQRWAQNSADHFGRQRRWED